MRLPCKIRSMSSAKAPAATSSRIERIIRGGLLVLLALMPFHAFLSVWLGSLTGYQAVIQSWKEVLLLGLVALTTALAIRQPERLQRLRQPAVMALAGFAVLALVVTALARPPLEVVIFGIKTDLEFLAAALVALLVASPGFMKRALQVVLISGGAVICFGLLQTLVLPPTFLTGFGYGPDTILPFQQLDSDTPDLRFGATLGGPNQFGTYLILILALALALARSWRSWWPMILVPLGIVTLFHTHSRAAWLGAAAALTIVGVGRLPRQWRLRAIGGVAVLGALFIVSLPILIRDNSPLQDYLLHGNDSYSQQRGSDYEHLASLQSGWLAVMTEPGGHGLGTAGPAVFHTGSGRIIENYYLQLGFETGLVGMLLFISSLILLGAALLSRRQNHTAALGLLAALVGISLNALVLPAWTDSTLIFTFWILAGGMIGLYHNQRKGSHVEAN
jgi:hypothetical protein